MVSDEDADEEILRVTAKFYKLSTMQRARRPFGTSCIVVVFQEERITGKKERKIKDLTRNKTIRLAHSCWKRFNLRNLIMSDI